jgi:N-acetylglucosaminyldiphosphoundecaprenol N-acetyl-beta-D-mannosaminyltransferase
MRGEMMSRQSTEVVILGLPITTLSMGAVVQTVAGWIERKQSRRVCACDVHSVIRALDDKKHTHALGTADLLLPDGVPLVWVGRFRGNKHMQRVCGPDLLKALCAQSVRHGWRHYFYGGAPGVSEMLAEKLSERHPGLRVAGTHCPPFRTLTSLERQQTADLIKSTSPDIVWVGLGCPKQEQWMLENAALLDGIVLIGIGAAFDFETGIVKRAPGWMQSSGLEWFYRLISEPRRLWRRYLVAIPRFAFEVLLELSAASRRGRAS